MQGIGTQDAIEWFRKQLAKMSDQELIKTGKSLKDLVSQRANFSRPPNPAFVAQLQEARAEWRRRHPKKP
jgi:hypothetical protein